MKQQEYDWQKFLGFVPNDPELFVTALTHKSYHNEHPHAQHNERLEFLGDAVLELITSTHVFHKFPEEQEGKLTKLRSAMVKGQNLANVAENLKLESLIRLSSGEAKAGGAEKPTVLANTLEALIGAIYLDQGLPSAQVFITDHILPTLTDTDNVLDPKSELQEWSQAELKQTPLYRVTSEDGPDHDKIYTVQVNLGGQKYGEGQGTSKQKAEQSAAQDALERMQEKNTEE